MEAFQRQYEDDHSWEQLQEDEFGRLRPLASALSMYLGNMGSGRTTVSATVFAEALC